MVKLGSCSTGTSWDEGGNTEIVQILISYGEETINAIQFVYAEKTGVSHSQMYGVPNGRLFETVTLDYPSEYSVSIRGNVAGSGKLVSISFCSNKRVLGTFGMPGFPTRTFNYEFGHRSCFGGFHGTVYDSCVHGFGVYINPIESLASNSHTRN